MPLHGLQEANRVTETTNMGESNGTNLKAIPPIIFLTSLRKCKVLLLLPDSWLERSWSISTLRGWEVLIVFLSEFFIL